MNRYGDWDWDWAQSPYHILNNIKIKYNNFKYLKIFYLFIFKNGKIKIK